MPGLGDGSPRHPRVGCRKAAAGHHVADAARKSCGFRGPGLRTEGESQSSPSTAVAVKDMNVNLPQNWDSPEQQAILDGLPALIFLERAGRIVFANTEARHLLGWAEEKWVSRPVEEVLWGLFPGTAEPQTALTGGHSSSPFHATLATHGGRLLPIEGTYCALSSERRDAVIVAQALVRERTPRPRLMEDVLASIPEAVFMLRGSRILYTNGAFTRMFGFTAEEV